MYFYIDPQMWVICIYESIIIGIIPYTVFSRCEISESPPKFVNIKCGIILEHNWPLSIFLSKYQCDKRQ